MLVILPFLTFALFLGALIDIILRRDDRVRHLPKFVWILIVILLPLIGSVLWFAIGREYNSAGPSVLSMPRAARGGARIPSPPVEPQRQAPSTEEQLAALEREIAFYENRDRVKELEAEIERRRKAAE
ncbi:PLDc N-terminal domain-containing protein [Leifsonia poae]|uniref:PLDc N-terminal domain-containing protein n=1 Tax=Leifsonia poae TaxID=110933 RepID=UPI001CC0E9C5|nr:PLDc N-terminal domain-containing protein [Leifsonia poae]